MNNDQISVAAAVGVVSVVLGWLARSFTMSSKWEAQRTDMATMAVQIASLSGELREFKTTFAQHLTADGEAQRHLDSKLAGLSRDVNRLIGRQEGPGP